MNLLLVRLSAMGDLVQSLGAVASLHAARPDARLTFVTQPVWAPLLEGLPGLARVVPFDRRGGLRGLFRVRHALRQERYDAALDLQGNWKSASVAWLSGARRRVGMQAAWRQEPSSGLLLTERVVCDATPHPARAAWELAKQVAPDAPFCRPALAATPDEVAREREALRQVGVDPERPFRVVVGTDPRDPRALRPARLASLWRAPQTVVVTGPAEPLLGDGVAGALLRHGPGEVRRLVGLGAAVAAADGEVVGPDQGASHVLLAAGARGKILFGSQDPRRTAPPTAIALQAPETLACRPCRRRVCDQVGADQFACMDFDLRDGAEVSLGLPDPPRDPSS
ncbi:MAG: glycosyltransferase family 9 protein [Planctomycetota bacterium]|nr:glycosyltransferase family 9 protein [Planctomycetota bacterium]